MKFPQYASIKDNYCCHYLGNSPEYIVLLKLLKPQIEEQLPGLRFHIVCNENLYYLLEGEPDTSGQIDEEKYAYVRELFNNNHEHSVLKLMNESNLVIKPVCNTLNKKPGLCLICPEGISPTKTMSESTLKVVLQQCKDQGHTPLILGSDVHYSMNLDIRPHNKEKFNYIKEAAWVLGVENEYLVMAASQGVKTTLFSGGVGRELFKKMFPCMELV